MVKFVTLIALCIVLVGGVSHTAAQIDETPQGWLFIPSIRLYKAVYPASNQNTYDLAEVGNGIVWADDSAWLNTTQYQMASAGGSLAGLQQSGVNPDAPAGRIVLIGHGNGGFAELSRVPIGAEIILSDLDITRDYVVVSTTVLAEQDVWQAFAGEPFAPSDVALITCLTDDLRLVVLAELKQ